MSPSVVLVDNQTLKRHNIALSTNAEDSSLTYVFTYGNDSVGVSSSYNQDNVKHVARICGNLEIYLSQMTKFEAGNYPGWVLRLEALSDNITLAAATVHQRSAHREESQYFHCLSLRKSSPSHTETAHLRVGDTINFGDSSSVTLALGEGKVEDYAADNEDGSPLDADAEASRRAVDLQSVAETPPPREEQLEAGGRISTSTVEDDIMVATKHSSLTANSPRLTEATAEATWEQLRPTPDGKLQSNGIGRDVSLFRSPASQTNRALHTAENRSESTNHAGSRIQAGEELQLLPLESRELLGSAKRQQNSDTDETESESESRGKALNAQSELVNNNTLRKTPPGSDGSVRERTSARSPSACSKTFTTHEQDFPSAETLIRRVKRRITESVALDTIISTPRTTRAAKGASSTKKHDPYLSSSALPKKSSARCKVQVPPASVATEYGGAAPCILFSNSMIPARAAAMKFLTSKGATQIENIKDPATNFLCVGNGELKKTGKLILSIAKAFRIVTDQWVLDSMNARYLLEPSPYLPKDPIREEQWGFQLADTLTSDCRRLFQGHRICFTPALKDDYGNGFDELSYILHQTGAKDVFSKKAQEVQRESESNIILLALEHGDLDAILMHDAGWTCYRKDIVSLSILRGRLDLESDEFQFIPVTGRDGDQKARKKRKIA